MNITHKALSLVLFKARIVQLDAKTLCKSLSSFPSLKFLFDKRNAILVCFVFATVIPTSGVSRKLFLKVQRNQVSNVKEKKSEDLTLNQSASAIEKRF